MEEYITGLLEVNVQVGCIMYRYASRESFVFERDIIGSTIRRALFNNLAAIVLLPTHNDSLIRFP